MEYYGSHTPGELLSSIPVIIPTVDGRVDGVFWPSNATQRACGLIVLSDSDSDRDAARRVLSHLRALCQLDGISVLEMSDIRSDASARVAHSARYALHLLAGTTYLRSCGVSDIAVIFCSGEAWHTSPQEMQAQLLTRCSKALLAISADWHHFTTQLATLTDSIRAAADCIRGLTRVQVLTDNANPQAGGSDGSTLSPLVFAFSATTAARQTLRLADALYNWTVDTLRWHTANPSTERLPVDSANQSPPERNWSNVRRKATHLRSERVHASNIARQNFMFLQHQWEAMLKDLEERDSIRAVNVRQQMDHVIMSAEKSLTMYGDAHNATMVLRAARNSWQFLDGPARDRWLKAWTQVFPFGGLGKTHPTLPAVSSSPLP